MITLLNPSAEVEVAKRLDITTPPLGLGYLAAVLRERGFKVKIIDDLVEKLSTKELFRRLKNSLVVGITSTTPTFNAALRYAQRIKEIFPHVFVILGGVHVTLKPRDALKHPFVDAVCIGEGEETIVEVAERVEAERSLEGVRGVHFRKDGRIVRNKPRSLISDLDSLPFPAFDLMPLEKYSLLGFRLEQFPVITSRGCPFRCRYCSSSLFMGRRFRARSAENVVDEIEWLIDEFAAKHIAFSDDTFTLNNRRVEAICDEIIRRGLEVEWSCSSRVDTIRPELLKKMRQAGCTTIYYGAESASPHVLKYYRKGIDIGKIERAVKLTKKAGISVVCSFIIGAPMETREDIERTISFAIKLDPDYAQFTILTPYPGTEIYEEAKRENLLITENYDDYTAAKPVLKNQHMSPDELLGLLKRCYLRFYLRPSFIVREIRKGNVGVVINVLRKIFRKA